MNRHRLKIVLAGLTLLLAQSASAQVSHRMKATAPDKMMPSDKTQIVRMCEKRAREQKIKMEDRARFVDGCVAAGAK